MNNVKATKLQKATLEIMKDNPEMPISKAMVQAGYTPKTATRPKINFVERRGVVVAMTEWRDKLRGRGLGEDKLLDKYSEWLDAKKLKSSMTEPDKIVPDYDTQLRAGALIRKDLGFENEQQTQSQVTNVQINLGLDQNG